MGKRNINIKGTQNRSYDLDEITSDSRENSEKELIVQIHRYKMGENPNPENLKVGQIWLSRLVVEDKQ